MYVQSDGAVVASADQASAIGRPVDVHSGRDMSFVYIELCMSKDRD